MTRKGLLTHLPLLKIGLLLLSLYGLKSCHANEPLYKVDLVLQATTINHFNDFSATATIYNNGDYPIEINLYTIAIAALEVQDLLGEPLPKYPFSVPDPVQFEAGKTIIKVGDKQSIPLHNLNVSNTYSNKAGQYKVRFHTTVLLKNGNQEENRSLKSDWKTIMIKSKQLSN